MIATDFFCGEIDMLIHNVIQSASRFLQNGFAVAN